MKSCSCCSNHPGSNLLRFINAALISRVLQCFADFWSSTHWFKLWKKNEKVAATKRSGHPDRHKSSWRNILGDRTCPGCSIHLNDYLSSTSHKSRQNGETSPSKWATDHATESHHTTENATWSIGRDTWLSFLRVMIHGSKNHILPLSISIPNSS